DELLQPCRDRHRPGPERPCQAQALRHRQRSSHVSRPRRVRQRTHRLHGRERPVDPAPLARYHRRRRPDDPTRRGLLDPDWGKSFSHLKRTRGYLASLPEGLASYPDCKSKASIWRNICRWTDITSLGGRLPPDLEMLASSELLDSAWIPTTLNFAGHLVLR